ncbi:anthranilate phosphoribosyltransferase [Microlunatus speluncae]|uniref:anthranilate phosphoribosyltransferase n=1 Tax=Microlunatus speluncae TaxID=2594267 RepID=UPI0012666ED4|nr:anthranilate phosphoribosyltransferase [Microlunatus speluncae]
MSASAARTLVAPTWPTVLNHLMVGDQLTRTAAGRAMARIVRGEITTAQLAAFVTALRSRGETAAELAGFVDALLAAAVPISIPGTTVDIAGTGGDGTGAVNISTMAAIVAAAAGATVVKHGGRSASSRTAGAADLAEALGIGLDLTPSAAARVAAEVGLVFLFAPRYNPGLRHAVDARRDLGVPTVFNLLAPLINPARPTGQVIGVADARMVPVIAETLAELGRSGLVVRGRDGLDKLTTVTCSDVWVVRPGSVSTTNLDPRELGLPVAEPADLAGGRVAHNARIARSLLTGDRGPVRDVVLLNAAAVLIAADPQPSSLAEQLAGAVSRCAEAIDSGAARARLRQVGEVSGRLAGDRC